MSSFFFPNYKVESGETSALEVLKLGDVHVSYTLGSTGHGSFVPTPSFWFIIKSIKRGIKTRPIHDCRCDERL